MSASKSTASTRKSSPPSVGRKSSLNDGTKKSRQGTLKRLGNGVGSNRTIDMFFSRAPLAPGTPIRPGSLSADSFGPASIASPVAIEAAHESFQSFTCPVCQQAFRSVSEREATRHINLCLDTPAQTPGSTTVSTIDLVTLDDDDTKSESASLDCQRQAPSCLSGSSDRDGTGTDLESMSQPCNQGNEYTHMFSSEESQAADVSIDFLNIDVDDFFAPIDDDDPDDAAAASSARIATSSTSAVFVTKYDSLDETGVPVAATDTLAPSILEETPSAPIVSSNRGKKRPCPFYKWIPGTQFTVDAFNFGAIPNCSAYFLTHFHSDHYMGLSGAFTHGPIYLSPITRALVRLQFPRVRPDLLRALPMNETSMVDGIAVTLLDANHCPGSVMFHFKLPNGQCHLHVGDFRAHPQMLQNVLLQQPIDSLFLDTTYLHPSHKFPPQHEVLDVLSEFVRRVASNEPLVITRRSTPRFPPPITYRIYNQVTPSSSKSGSDATTSVCGLVDPYLPPAFQFSSHLHLDQLWDEPVTRLLVVVGSYTVGKEKVFMSIVESLNTHFHCDARKWSLFQTYNDLLMTTRYTPNPLQAQVHVVSMRDVNPQSLHTYLDKYGESYSHVLAIKPTGWTFTDKDGKGGTKLDAPTAACSSFSTPLSGPRQRSITELWGAKTSSGATTPSYRESTGPVVHIPKRRLYMSDLSPQWIGKRVAVFGVPYSEHSSFSELRGFVRGLHVRKVVPTVGVGSPAMRAEMDKYLGEWQRDKWAGGRSGSGIPWTEEDEI